MQPQSAPETPELSFLNLARPAFDAWSWVAQRALNNWAEYQAESARFVAKRCQRNLEFVRCLPRCNDWKELAELQQRWQSDFSADYVEEFGRLIGTNLDLAENTLIPFQPLICHAPRKAKPVPAASGQTRSAA